MVVPFHLSFPVSHNSAQTCTTAAIITVITYTCAFPAMTYQNVCCEKGLFHHYDSFFVTLLVSKLHLASI